jgi:hypothetical protein
MAVVTKGEIAGRIVEVIGICPKNVEFELPDGQFHTPVPYEWIVKLQNPASCRFEYRGQIFRRPVSYAPAPDHALCPISGVPIEDEVTTEAPA